MSEDLSFRIYALTNELAGIGRRILALADQMEHLHGAQTEMYKAGDTAMRACAHLEDAGREAKSSRSNPASPVGGKTKKSSED